MSEETLNQLVDKQNMMLLLGCYCNHPKLTLDKQSESITDDYPEAFHRMIFVSISNLAKQGIAEIDSLDIENDIRDNERAMALWNIQNGYDYIINVKEMAKHKENNARYYRDSVRKYSIIRDAIKNLGLNVKHIYDESDDLIMARFNTMSVEELSNQIKLPYLDFEAKWTTGGLTDNSSHKLGEVTEEVIEEYKTSETIYGYPFQSNYMNTILRGMRNQILFLRSSPSGQGKTRNSIADATNVSCDRMYDWNKKEWITLGEKEPVLFISTEISIKALERMVIAHISGISQYRFNDWESLTDEEKDIVHESIEVIKNSTMYIEYMPEFTIDSIKQMIERHIIKNGVTKVFFDYINDSPQIYAEFYEKSKTRLRTDQILFLFSNSLKQIADNYNIFLSTSTQLNDNYKQEESRDSSALKGSKSIAEKVDIGILALPITQKMRESIAILSVEEGKFGVKEPNMCYVIYKNRDGRYNNVMVFTRLDLGTMREEDCFVTDMNYKIIKMDKTNLLDNMDKANLFDSITVNEAETIQTESNYDASDIKDMIQSCKS